MGEATITGLKILIGISESDIISETELSTSFLAVLGSTGLGTQAMDGSDISVTTGLSGLVTFSPVVPGIMD